MPVRIATNHRFAVHTQVGAAPEAVMRPANVDFVAGGSIRLQCVVEASPPASVVWRRGGAEISSAQYRTCKCSILKPARVNVGNDDGGGSGGGIEG